MSRTFDPRPLYGFIPSFWQDFYLDKPRLVRMWESLARIADDEWAQLLQIDDASNVWTCPSLIYHTYVYRELEDWHSYGVPHFHYRKDFRAAAGQTVFYLGAWISVDEAAVFVDGKELDVEDDPYVLTQVQDATQPGTNPSGTRLIFSNPRALNEGISLFSDREIFYIEQEVPAGGLTEFLSGRTLDPYSAVVTLKKLNLTRFLQLTANSFSWSSTPSLLVEDTREFVTGEVFEIVDAGVSQTVSLIATTQTVTFPTAVNPLTAQVYKVLDLEITDGKLRLDGTVFRAYKVLPPALRIRFTDVYGTVSRVTPLSSSINLGRAFDENTIKGYLLGGEILGAYSADTDGVRLARSFMEGTVIAVQMAVDEPNDHASFHGVTTTVTQDIDVPPTRPFNLTPTLTEKAGFPVQVYVDGLLLHPDTYTFLSTTRVRISIGFLPIGTQTDVHWVDLEDPQPHLHVDEEITVGSPSRAFELSTAVSDIYPRYVSVDGVVKGEPAERWFSVDGKFLTFYTALSEGSIVRVRGANHSYYFYHDIDVDLIRAAYLQDGIDQRSGTIPAGWETQLVWQEGFNIEDGLLEANARVRTAWFVDAFVDERTGYNNFGSLIGFDRATSDEYMRILRALYSGSYAGSRKAVLESLICIIMGSEYLAQGGEVQAIENGEVKTAEETVELDPAVPARVSAGESYEKLWAVSSFAEIVDSAPPEFLPQAVEDFSPDYKFARSLDTRVSTILEGGPVDFYTETQTLEDLNTDFVEENVWPGDLVRMAPTGLSVVYCRVVSVERHHLVLDSNLQGFSSGYGEEGYGEWVYGGGLLIISDVYYKIWVRALDRLDEELSLDRAKEEDIPYLNERMTDLFSPFVGIIHLRWAGLRSAQALDDVQDFLERSKPEESGYLVYARAYEEEGIQDELSGTLGDQDQLITQYPDFVYMDEGIVGVNGQTSPNAGSFVGIP